MANMASVAYAIEGSRASLEIIGNTIVKAINSKDNLYEENKACQLLGFTEDELKDCRLGGEISEEPYFKDDVLRFWAEERWGLQDFHLLLKQKFPDITVYWVVEECGNEIYCTNDREGKYFPEKYWIDICIDGEYGSEYFITGESMYNWLSNSTDGKIKSADDVKAFNSKHEDLADDDENYINIHEFEVVD